MSAEPSVWRILGVARDATEREIRRAYAAKLKQVDMVRDVAGFEALRRAYEIALARRRSAPVAADPVAEETAAEPARPVAAARLVIERSPASDPPADPGELFKTMKSLVAKPDYSVEPWLRLLNDPMLDFPQVNDAFEYELVRALSEGELDTKLDLSAGPEWRSLVERRYAWVSDGLRYTHQFPRYTYLRDVLAYARRPQMPKPKPTPGEVWGRLRRYWWIMIPAYVLFQVIWKAIETGAN